MAGTWAGVELSGAIVEIAWQSLLLFMECWSVIETGGGRMTELERASLPLAIRFGHLCQCQRLAVAVMLQKTTINSYDRVNNNNNNMSMAVAAANNNQQLLYLVGIVECHDISKFSYTNTYAQHVRTCQKMLKKNQTSGQKTSYFQTHIFLFSS